MRIDYDEETKRIAKMTDISRSAFVAFLLALSIVAGAAIFLTGVIYG